MDLILILSDPHLNQHKKTGTGMSKRVSVKKIFKTNADENCGQEEQPGTELNSDRFIRYDWDM